MPNGDNLTIRHTPETIPGGARPGWGLPFKKLPAFRTQSETPERSVEEEISTGKRRIQEKYALQWQTVNSNARFLGPQKHKAMLQKIDASAKQEMLEFNQQAEQQLAQFKQLDQIAATGGITPEKVEELKAGMAYGRDVAEAMHPEPEKERSIPAQFGELDLYGRRISGQLEFFQSPKKPSKLGAAISAASPLAGAIATYRKHKNKLKVWDPTTGEFKIAGPEDIARYVALVREEKDIARRKDELLGHPSISRRVVQPGTQGGTFGDKVAASIKQPSTKRQPRTQRQEDPLGLYAR
ncbi:MAG: hypothetical protein V3T88_03585 [Nitrosomonadaceae bacterium]